jgi:hypothetical protein
LSDIANIVAVDTILQTGTTSPFTETPPEGAGKPWLYPRINNVVLQEKAEAMRLARMGVPGTTCSCGQPGLLPRRRDRLILYAVVAAVNLPGSFTLSPAWGHIGMAITVLLSESVVALRLAWNVLRWREVF